MSENEVSASVAGTRAQLSTTARMRWDYFCMEVSEQLRGPLKYLTLVALPINPYKDFAAGGNSY
jgi:hypothetical protein